MRETPDEYNASVDKLHGESVNRFSTPKLTPEKAAKRFSNLQENLGIASDPGVKRVLTEDMTSLCIDVAAMKDASGEDDLDTPAYVAATKDEDPQKMSAYIAARLESLKQ